MQLSSFLGKKRHGKDTAGDYLVKCHNYEKRCFARPLKDMCRISFLLNEEQLYGNLKEVIDVRWNKTPRELLQYLGTDIFRNKIDKNFWINHMKYWIDDKINPKKNDYYEIKNYVPLKEITRIAFLLTKEQMYDKKLENIIDDRWHKTPIQLLECIENIFIEEFGNNFWINHANYLLESGIDYSHPVVNKNKELKLVITDVRFPNEVDAVHQLGGKVYKIIRPSLEQNNSDGHISETIIDEINTHDEIIVNDGSIDELYYKVEQLIAKK